ncbi:MAG: ABC transporter ATP-binding protein [Actinomycetota bacterium]
MTASTDRPTHLDNDDPEGVGDGQGLRRGGLMRTVWHLAGDRRRVLARSIGWKAAQATAQAIPVGVIVLIIDRVRTDELSSSDIGWSTAVIGVCVVAQWIFGYLANRSSWVATFRMFGDVRVRGLDHLRRVPMGFHDQHRSGDTLTALTQDVGTVESFTHEPFQQMIGAFTAPIVVFVILVVQDVPMALATLASVVVAYPVFIWTNRLFARLGKRRQELQAEASSRMVEYVQGLPVIRAFRLTGERLDRFRIALDDFRAANLELVLKITPLGMAFAAVVMLGVPCVLFFGTLWLFDGTIDAGTLIVFAVLVLRVYEPLLVAATHFEGMRITDASLSRVARVFDEPVQPVPTEPAHVEGADVTFEAVTFGYDADQPVLSDVSFTAEQGTMTAIVGPSGAGKSTVLNLIARFWDPQSGAVRIGGADVRELTAEQLFDAVTVVFQDVYLFPGTIGDNIAFGSPHAEQADIERAARAARAHDFVTALPDGYATTVEEAGGNLSGGERQRIAIARAILKDTPIVLLDEATSAIDPTNERLVQAALGELVTGKTLIVVAHRLSTIRSADHILVLDGGHAVAGGTHENLLAEEGLYARLWSERRRAANWRLPTRSTADPSRS